MDAIKWETVNGRVDYEHGLEFRSYAYDSAMLKSTKSIKSGKIMFNALLDSRNNDRTMIFTINLDNDRKNEHLSILFHSDGNIEIWESRNNYNKQLSSLVNNNSTDERNGLPIMEVRNRINTIKCDIVIEICGSVITIYRNGIELLNAYKTTKYLAQINANFEGQGLSVIKNFTVNNMKLTAFVVMEFTDQFNKIYTEVIKPTCEKHDILCIRSDEICCPGKITSDILETIKEADIIIVEATPDNANVYFELGYAEAFDKQIIPLVDKNKRSKLPFDIYDIRTIFYENSEIGTDIVINKLSNFIVGIKESTFGGSIYRSILLNEHERIDRKMLSEIKEERIEDK